MIHYFLPRFREIAEAELPEAVEALDADGVLRYNPIALAPESVTGGFRDGDERFEAMTGRRPMVEAAFARTAAATPNVTVRRGVAVKGLLTGEPALEGVPHVVGVVTDTGDEMRADLVVDATGRRSPLPSLLEAIGAVAPEEEIEDSGFVYYGRYFRSHDGSLPPAFGPLLQHYDSVSVLTLPADNGTWGMGIVASAGDATLRAARDVEVWERVDRQLPPDRALARRRSDDRHPAHGQDRGPAPQLRRRRTARRHRCGAGRRLVGVHESVGRPRGVDRPHPRPGPPRPRPRPRPRRSRGVRHRLARRHRRAGRAAVPGHPRVRSPPTRRDRRPDRRRPLRDRGPRAGRSARRWQRQVGAIPICSVASSRSSACSPEPSEVLARPGVLDKVLAAAETPAEPPPGPSRAELVELVGAAS